MMSDTLDSVEQSPAVPNRRAQLRQSIRSLAYVDLGFGNGGIILNVSEGGLAVRAVTALVENSVPKMRFQPSASKAWIEVGGEIAWRSESNTMVGIRFLELPEESRTRIREWITLEAAPIEASRDRVRHPFESGSTNGSAEEMLPSPAEAAVTVQEAPADAAQSLIPTWPSDLQIDNSKTLVPAPSIASMEASSSPLPPTTENIPVRQKPAWNRSQRKAAAFVAFFAAVSLAAGWVVGRDMMDRRSAKIQASSSVANSAAANTTANASARTFVIEVVDSNDHRWTVPFNGPPSVLSAPVGQNSPSKSSASPEPIDKTPPALRIWTPSAPIVSKNTSRQEPLADAATTAGLPPNIDASDPSGLFRVSNPNLPAPVLRPSGGYRDGQLIHRVEPIYPHIAQDSHVEGVVKLRVQIASDGTVKQVEALSGSPLLLMPAVTAVRQWRYQPSTLDGKAIEVQKNVDIHFTLPK